MNHSKLPTNLIRCNWHIFTDLLRIANDIQVRACRLDHDNICAFANISVYGAASQPAAAGGKLVAFPVTEGGAGARCVAEGAIQTTGEFGGVGH